MATALAQRHYRRILLSAALLALAFWLLGSRSVAHAATRWGPPWQGVVVVDRAVVYTQLDRASPPVGPLGRDAIVVVLDERKAANGSRWVVIPDGFMPAEEVEELISPWTAQVSVPTVSIYAKPFVASGIRRTARQDDLLRVTGVSAGLEGDSGVWWATTEGYLPLRTLRWATDDWAHWWGLPEATEAPNGWWGTITSQASVRAAPSRLSPMVGTFAGGERVKVLTEEQGESVNGNPLWYRIDGGRYAGARVHSSLLARLPDPKPNTTSPPATAPAGPWLVVDRTASTLTYVKDGQPLFATYVALGKAGVATPAGTYSTFGKFLGDRMSSRNVVNPTGPYDLPNVPFTQYYLDGGFAIHGTYWHDGFGRPESQGCINLTWTDASYLFSLTLPRVPPGADERWAATEFSTPVVILD